MFTRRRVLAVAPAVLVAGIAVTESREGQGPPQTLAEGIARLHETVAAGESPRPLERQLAELPAKTPADAAAASAFVASWCNAHCNDACVQTLAAAVAAYVKNAGLAVVLLFAADVVVEANPAGPVDASAIEQPVDGDEDTDAEPADADVA